MMGFDISIPDGFHYINSPDPAQVAVGDFMWIYDLGTTAKKLRLKRLVYARVIVGFKK